MAEQMPTHREREDFKEIAERVSSRLIAEAKAGKRAKVGIDEIRAELALETQAPRDSIAWDTLEELTTRRFVEKCS